MELETHLAMQRLRVVFQKRNPFRHLIQSVLFQNQTWLRIEVFLHDQRSVAHVT